MNTHRLSLIAIAGLASVALGACAGQSPSTQPTPTIATTPRPTQESLLPDGSWQVVLTGKELMAAGAPANGALGGTFTWTFAATRARIVVDYVDGSHITCIADAEPAGELVRLDYEPGFYCGGEVDTIGWQRDGQDLRLTLDTTNAGTEANRAYLEAKVWQPVQGAPLGTSPPWESRCEPGCQGPMAAGTFTSVGFMPGLQMAFTDDSWFNTADDFDEIEFDSGQDAFRFWQQPGASSEAGDLLNDVPRTVDGLTDWFVSNPDMVVSDREQVTIGDGIDATTFTFSVSDTNVNVNSDCPVRSCLNVLWITEGHVFGIGYGSVSDRLYLFTVGTGTDARTIVVSLDAANEHALELLTGEVQPILASLRVP
jgi:hypothetical protein